MLTAALPINRRRFERFHTMPMYTPVRITTADDADRTLEGHAYDISEGGLRFELDHAIPPGTSIAIHLDLPRWLPAPLDAAESDEAPATVSALARVIWTDDDGVPGPVRMAAAFTGFLQATDRARLLDTLAAGALRRAA